MIYISGIDTRGEMTASRSDATIIAGPSNRPRLFYDFAIMLLSISNGRPNKPNMVGFMELMFV